MLVSSIILIIILIGLILSLPCTFGLKGNELDLLQGFLINGITEIIGILVTLWVVNYLLEKQEEKRIAPLKRVALQEVNKFVWKTLRLLVKMHKAATNKALPKSIDELLSKQSFNEICNHLDLNQKAPALPEITWRNYIVAETQELTKIANFILGSYYINYLPEKSVELITNILKSYFFLMSDHLLAIQQVETIYGPRFASGLEENMAQQFASLSQLITILNSEKIYYTFSDIAELADNVKPEIGDSRIE